MATWHQQKGLQASGAVLYHETKWTCYSAQGALSVMRFDTQEQAEQYAKNTGDLIMPPKGQSR